MHSWLRAAPPEERLPWLRRSVRFADYELGRRPWNAAKSRSKMQMGDDPDDRNGERDHKHNEEQPAFAALLAERARATVPRGVFAVALVLQRHRDIEAIAALAGALQEQFAVAPRPFLRDPWCFLDQALEVLHLPAQILFESGEFLLLLIERRVGAGASACPCGPHDSARSGKRQ